MRNPEISMPNLLDLADGFVTATGVGCKVNLHRSTPRVPWALAVAFGISLWGNVAGAASFTINMTTDWTFSPASLQIQVGDTVTWTNEDNLDFHDSYCSGIWYSGPLDYGQQWSLMFPVLDTFSYEDSRYYIVGMTGTIVVGQAVPAPLLTNVVMLTDGTFQCTVTNLVVGKTNIVQASSDLLNWTSIYTNVAFDTGFLFLDNAAAISPRFYRAYVVP
jgi:plastocyanin